MVVAVSMTHEQIRNTKFEMCTVMVIRCPTCNFTGKLTHRSRLTADQYPVCPRCHTLIPVPDLKGTPVDPLLKAELDRQRQRRVHWETRSSWLDLAAFWRTSSNILFHPSATFADLNYSSGTRSSLVFAIVYGSLGQLLGRYWFTLLGIHYGVFEGDALTNTLRFAVVALFVPISVLIFVFFTASLVHIFLRLLFAAKRTFSATVQVVAYGSGAASLLNVIPILGSFLAPIWALVVWCIGLARAHQTSRAKTGLALLLPFVLAVLFVLALIAVIAAQGVMELLRTIQVDI